MSEEVGKFITFEGPDGGGKSTQIRSLAEALRARSLNVLLTREPGGTDIGEQIRHVLHDLKNTAMQPRAELLLYAAARAQLIGQLIIPHLQAGGVVLSDRFFDSTLAYQGYGHGMDLQQVRYLCDFATGGLVPDLTLLFDIEPEAGLRRRQANAAEWNRLDNYALEFHTRVRKGYLELAKQEPDRWRVIDASKTQNEVLEQVRPIVSGFLGIF